MAVAMRGVMLDKLNAANVFSIEWLPERELFAVTEGCDGHFTHYMTPDDLVSLARELIKSAAFKGSE